MDKENTRSSIQRREQEEEGRAADPEKDTAAKDLAPGHANTTLDDATLRLEQELAMARSRAERAEKALSLFGDCVRSLAVQMKQADYSIAKAEATTKEDDYTLTTTDTESCAVSETAFSDNKSLASRLSLQEGLLLSCLQHGVGKKAAGDWLCLQNAVNMMQDHTRLAVEEASTAQSSQVECQMWRERCEREEETRKRLEEEAKERASQVERLLVERKILTKEVRLLRKKLADAVKVEESQRLALDMAEALMVHEKHLARKKRVDSLDDKNVVLNCCGASYDSKESSEFHVIYRTDSRCSVKSQSSTTEQVLTTQHHASEDTVNLKPSVVLLSSGMQLDGEFENQADEEHLAVELPSSRDADGLVDTATTSLTPRMRPIKTTVDEEPLPTTSLVIDASPTRDNATDVVPQHISFQQNAAAVTPLDSPPYELVDSGLEFSEFVGNVWRSLVLPDATRFSSR